jgi:uncharacterized Zn-finger protein
MAPFETVETDEMTVACSGSGDGLGHPRVFLNLAPAGRVECPYCSRLFVNRAAAHPHAAETGYSDVASPSAHGPGAADEEQPPPINRRSNTAKDFA